MHRCLGPCVAGLTTKEAYDEAVRAGAAVPRRPQRAAASSGCKREMWEAAEALGLRARRASCATRSPRSRRSAQRRKLSSVEGRGRRRLRRPRRRRQRRGGGAGHARRPGARPPRAVLGGVGPVAPERLLSELLPQIYDRTTFIPKEIHLPVPIEGEEALLEWLSREEGGAGLPAAAVARPQGRARGAGHAQRRAGPPAPLPRRLGAPGRGRRRWRATSASTSRRGASRASTSPTSRAARRWPRMVVWEEGRMRKGEYRSFNIRGLPGRTTSPRCARRSSAATAACWRRWARCPT